MLATRITRWRSVGRRQRVAGESDIPASTAELSRFAFGFTREIFHGKTREHIVEIDSETLAGVRHFLANLRSRAITFLLRSRDENP